MSAQSSDIGITACHAELTDSFFFFQSTLIAHLGADDVYSEARCTRSVLSDSFWVVPGASSVLSDSFWVVPGATPLWHIRGQNE